MDQSLEHWRITGVSWDGPLTLSFPFFPQWVPHLHPLHRDKVPVFQLLLAQSPGGEIHHPHTQALFLQLPRGAARLEGPVRWQANHAHPHPRFPHTCHDRLGGLVQQEERHPGLGGGEEGGEGLSSMWSLFAERIPQTTKMCAGSWELVKLFHKWLYKPPKHLTGLDIARLAVSHCFHFLC